MCRGRNASAHYPIIFRNRVFDCDLNVRPGLMQTFQKLLNPLSPFLALFRFNFVIRGVKSSSINPLMVNASLLQVVSYSCAISVLSRVFIVRFVYFHQAAFSSELKPLSYALQDFNVISLRF